jgi:YVTN family beta-propeller protein
MTTPHTPRATGPALVLVCLLASVFALSPFAEGRDRPLPPIAEPADGLSKLQAPTANGLTCVYWEDFQQGAGGWVPTDLTAQPAYWHRATYSSVGVMWCGTETPGWTGYGNNWIQYLTKSFSLPAGSVSISYRLQYDTELDFDFLYLDVSTNGGQNYTVLRTWTGLSAGLVTGSTSLNAYAGNPVVIRFRFTSDGGWSDEDGQYNTDGAARLDYVQVTGFPTDDFESSDNDWIASGPAPGPAAFRLEEIPGCTSSLPCDDYCFSWVAYDPISGVFPTEAPETPIEIGIESAAIAIPTGATQYLLKFDVYANLPQTGQVYYRYGIAAPPPQQGGAWTDYAFMVWGNTGFYTVTWDITSLIPAGTTQIKVRLWAFDYCTESGGTCLPRTPAPIFDNVAIYAANTTAPVVDDVPLVCGADSDADGVLDADDLCPGVNPSPFDGNGDGCMDDGVSARHIEYWDRTAFPLACKWYNQGAPGISDGSDLVAAQDAFASWTTIPGIVAAVSSPVATTQKDAQALDGVNLITFEDPDYQFGAGTIAVGLTTSFTEATWFANGWRRPGEIADSDLIFNPLLSFRTDTQGPPDGIYLEAVLAHEIGHFFGIAHTAAKSPTMYFVLPEGTGPASLEWDEKSQIVKAYGTPATMASASRLGGTVTDGYTSNPIAGAVVFALSVARDDTSGCEYTLPDGSYEFIGLPDGDYYITIHPLDGSSAVGYIRPAYINDYVAGMPLTMFVPESWDSAESAHDNAGDRGPITVTAGLPAAVADIVTNIDDVHPTVVSTVPDTNAAGVPIDAAILLSLSERMNSETLQGNFSLTDTTTHVFVPGNAAFLREDSLIAFVPMAELAFASTYKLTLETGLEDGFGNGLAQEFVMHFTTEPEPDVAMTSLSPSKGVVGMMVAVNGKGFDPVPTNNIVRFNGIPATVLQGSSMQLVVLVPDAASSGAVNVYNPTQGETSNDLQFTVLGSDEVPKGLESGVCVLGATPRALTVMPDGGFAFVATETGAAAVVTTPGAPGYMTATQIPITGGLTDIDAGPANNRVYGVSSATGMLYRLNATPGSMGVLSEKPVGAVPRGILIDPSGTRAFIPTDEGQIQVWDIDEASPSFETQIGVIAGVDASVRGDLAIDPAGDFLLALTGTGKMQVADLDSNLVTQSASIGTYPRDVAVDAVMDRAYICDEAGFLSVASLSQGVSLWRVRTGGTLYGACLTPGGAFALVVNRELDMLSAIDLRETSESFLSVVATVSLPENPIGIELSPDGDYAFTISEAEAKLVATAVGVGPSLGSLSRRAGPVGTKLVLAGSGFAAEDGARVLFNGTGGVWTEPDRLTDVALTVEVPAAATSGMVRLATFVQGAPHMESNSWMFELLGTTEDEMLRPAADLPGTPSPTADGGAVMQPSPRGDYLALADESGGLHALVVDSESPQYHTYAGSLALGSNASDIAFAPDGERAFVVLPDSGHVLVAAANRLKANFLVPLHTLDFSGIAGSNLARAAVSLDGSLLLVSDPGAAMVHCMDITVGSPSEYQIIESVDVSGGSGNGQVLEMALHPGGTSAYLAREDPDQPAVVVLDTDPQSPQYLSLGNQVNLFGTMPIQMPVSLSFTPDGERCLVLTRHHVGDPTRSIVMLDAFAPGLPSVSKALSIGGTSSPTQEHIEVSPRGDRAVANVHEDGLYNLEIKTIPDSLIVLQLTGEASDHLTSADIAYSVDGSQFYCLSESSDTLLLYDFTAAQAIAVYSGNGQSGVVNQPLALPLRAKVTGAVSEPVAGVPVRFMVTSGGGRFAAVDTTEQVVATNAGGIAEASLTLGPDLGAGAHTVQASASGLTGSPLIFAADGIADPTTLPLALVSVVPDSGMTGVSIASATLTAFSRPVDVLTVTSSSFYLHDGDFIAIPAVFGFADANRKVSLTPQTALDPNTTFWIQVTTGIRDESGGPLDQAVVSSFTTEPPPLIELASIAPVSGQAGDRVVLSGDGFNSQVSLNTVLFGSVPAYVTSGGTDFLSVAVPAGAATNAIKVINTALPDTSNEISFTILPPDVTYMNDVVGSVTTSSATRSVSITPDGALAFAVSPDANHVSVIDLRNLVHVATIAVGENPVAVTVDRTGSFAYVANHVDGTVSVIDANPSSPSYCQVVDAFSVGVGPTDIVITPDGSRLIVANFGSGTISVVDADATSETYRSVVSSITTGSGSRTVAISPDGGLIYIGIESGYLVLSATSYGVVTGVNSGSGSRTVAITPDGAFLVILTTDGVVNIYDVRNGSPWENQVVTSIRTDSGATTVAISPDGGFLYLIEEVGDRILVGVLSISPRFGVMEEGEELPPYGVGFTIVDSLAVGEDPADIAFDPTGSGKVIVTTAGDRKLTVLGEPIIGTDGPEPPQALLGFPNPFSRTTTIRFAIHKREHVRLAVYDVTGRLVRVLVDADLAPSTYSVAWDGTDGDRRRVASGVYFCKINAEGLARSKKMLLMR